MKWKGFQRKRPWPNRDPIPAFAWKDLKNKHIGIACVPVGIRNPNLPNTSVEHYRYANWLDPYNVDWFMEYLRFGLQTFILGVNKQTNRIAAFFVITTSVFLQLTLRSELEVRGGLGGQEHMG
jgi:hypothetical protein